MALHLGKKSLEKYQQEFKIGEVVGSILQGKIVLIKSFLSSLYIFECSGLLAPKGVLEKSLEPSKVSSGLVGKGIQKSFIF
jgi:hypothetical protein